MHNHQHLSNHPEETAGSRALSPSAGHPSQAVNESTALIVLPENVSLRRRRYLREPAIAILEYGCWLGLWVGITAGSGSLGAVILRSIFGDRYAQVSNAALNSAVGASIAGPAFLSGSVFYNCLRATSLSRFLPSRGHAWRQARYLSNFVLFVGLSAFSAWLGAMIRGDDNLNNNAASGAVGSVVFASGLGLWAIASAISRSIRSLER